LGPLNCSDSELTSAAMNNIGHIGGTPYTGGIGPSKGLYLHWTAQQRKRGRTSIPRAGFKPTIPGFEMYNTIRALE